MADEAKGQSSGRSLTWLWMILSLVVVGGFLVWLGMASEPTAVAVVEEPEEEGGSAGPGGGVTVVVKDSLAANKAAYEGQEIQVAQVEATTSLGPAIFWGELGDRANQVPILVRLDSAAAQGWELRQSALYTLTGEVQRMTDSLATMWGEEGEFSGEGEQMQATFADYFIQASRIRPSRASEGSGSGSSGPGGTEPAEGG